MLTQLGVGLIVVLRCADNVLFQNLGPEHRVRIVNEMYKTRPKVLSLLIS